MHTIPEALILIESHTLTGFSSSDWEAASKER